MQLLLKAAQREISTAKNKMKLEHQTLHS